MVEEKWGDGGRKVGGMHGGMEVGSMVEGG